MKQLILFCLILTFSSACKKANREASPSDPLYQNWKLIESRSSNGSWRTITYDSFIKFHTDGHIRYEKPNPPCCSPIQVERQAETLKVTQIYAGPGCEYVDCASPSAIKIVSITAQELVIEFILGTTNPVSNGFLKYKPAK